jgi:hypothetical protein
MEVHGIYPLVHAQGQNSLSKFGYASIPLYLGLHLNYTNYAGNNPVSCIWLVVGGFNVSEKYESQLGLLFPIYGKIKFMFRTNNQ